jgi:hypothetical protein
MGGEGEEPPRLPGLFEQWRRDLEPSRRSRGRGRVGYGERRRDLEACRRSHGRARKGGVRGGVRNAGRRQRKDRGEEVLRVTWKPTHNRMREDRNR